MSAFQEITAAAGRLSGVTNQRPVTAHNSMLGKLFGLSGPTGITEDGKLVSEVTYGVFADHDPQSEPFWTPAPGVIYPCARERRD